MSAQGNPALEAIEEILSPPELTQEEWAIVEKAKPWLMSTLKPDVLKELDSKYEKREEEWRALTTRETQKQIEETMEKWKEAQKPLSPDEINILLSQKYTDFTFTTPVSKHNKEEKTFNLVELPYAVEERYIDIAEKQLIPLIEELSSIEFRMTGEVAEELQIALRKVPQAMKVALELVAVILDPWQEHEDITPNWVMNNLSLSRISTILLAQSEANRYRDFFLNGSQLFQMFRKTR
jgi:hypothetical protein